MYSTCVSECFVPLMNVTAEISGHAPCVRMISSAPRPFCTVITVAPGKWPSSVAAAASSSVVFVATITRSGSGSSRGSAAAVTRAVKSWRPETRNPSRLSTSACSARRVSTSAWQTVAMWAA